MIKPLVSIVLPVYNGEKYLSQSIESCLNQTYNNLELIIVNDCSKDKTLEISGLYAAKDNRIKIINNLKNMKLPASLNIGHKVAKGNFITWTSDDNFYELNAIEELLQALLKKQVDIVYSDICLVNDIGDKIREVKFVPFENIIFGNFIGSCFLYSRSVFDRNNGYDENLFLVEDYDFWLRATLHSRFYQLQKRLYNYRIHQGSLTSHISTDVKKNHLFKNNIRKMYTNFSKMILTPEGDIISDLQTKFITYEKINFSWIKKNNLIIKEFKNNLIKNENFANRKIVEKVFLDRVVHVMISDKNYFSKSLFIISNYYKVLDKNTIKTLIKYSFFKK
jgi:glycosyltransferase involved in cell wall biosynthesis